MSKNLVDKNRKASEFAKNLYTEGYAKAEIRQVFKLAKYRFEYLTTANNE